MFISFGREAPILLALALVAILQSTLSKVIGRQFDKSNREPSSFGLRVVISLLWEIESSFASKASLKLSTRLCPNSSKKNF